MTLDFCKFKRTVREAFSTPESYDNGIFSVSFTSEDIMRSELCKFIVFTFEKIPKNK